jgi:hypothetical protein
LLNVGWRIQAALALEPGDRASAPCHEKEPLKEVEDGVAVVGVHHTGLVLMARSLLGV